MDGSMLLDYECVSTNLMEIHVEVGMIHHRGGLKLKTISSQSPSTCLRQECL